jgi:hypothetical protein
MKTLRKKRATVITDDHGRRRVATRTDVGLLREIELQRSNTVIAQAKLRGMQIAVGKAKEEGAAEILRAEYLPDQLADMMEQLTDKWGEAAKPVIGRLLAADRNRRRDLMKIDVSMRVTDRKETVVRGTIPEINYCFVVMD